MHLDDDLARQVAERAAERGERPEQLLSEVLRRHSHPLNSTPCEPNATQNHAPELAGGHRAGPQQVLPAEGPAWS
jgi:hypothetical protein